MRTKKAFKVKQKAFFVIFKGRSIAKNCLRPDSAPFRPSKNLLRHEKAKQKQKFKFFFSPRQRSGREEIKNCLKKYWTTTFSLMTRNFGNGYPHRNKNPLQILLPFLFRYPITEIVRKLCDFCVHATLLSTIKIRDVNDTYLRHWHLHEWVEVSTATIWMLFILEQSILTDCQWELNRKLVT